MSFPDPQVIHSSFLFLCLHYTLVVFIGHGRYLKFNLYPATHIKKKPVNDLNYCKSIDQLLCEWNVGWSCVKEIWY